jgi:FixJ family two-component response regulator
MDPRVRADGPSVTATLSHAYPACRRPTVHVVDDDPSVRESLVAILHTASVDIIASASAEEFLDKFDSHSDVPRCLLLDVRMPGLSGLGLQSKLAAESKTIPIIFVTGQSDVRSAVEAMRNGAVDYVEKPVHPHVLLDKVRKAIDLDAQSRYRQTQSQKLARGLQFLSDREREVMALLLDARNTKEIAAHLGIGVQTVSKHRASLFEKLGVRNVVELMRLLQPGE